MPKEVRKRGRRAEKKRKEEAAEVAQNLEEYTHGVILKQVLQEEGRYGEGGTLSSMYHFFAS